MIEVQGKGEKNNNPRSRDNPHFDQNDGFKGKFYAGAEEVEWIKD